MMKVLESQLDPALRPLKVACGMEAIKKRLLRCVWMLGPTQKNELCSLCYHLKAQKRKKMHLLQKYGFFLPDFNPTNELHHHKKGGQYTLWCLNRTLRALNPRQYQQDAAIWPEGKMINTNRYVHRDQNGRKEFWHVTQSQRSNH